MVTQAKTGEEMHRQGVSKLSVETGPESQVSQLCSPQRICCNAGKDRRRDAQTRGQQIVCRNRARESSFPALQPAEDLLQLLTCTEVVQKAAAVTCKGVSVARSEHQWAGYVSWAIVC